MTTPRARLPFRLLVLLALFLLQAALPESADASYISVRNQRIDRALHRPHAPREVLAGRIAAIRLREGANPEAFPYHRDLDVRVEGVLLGEPQRKGTVLRLTSAHFEWPAALVPFAVGSRLILIVKPLESPEAFDVLLAELAAEKDPQRQRKPILQAGCVLEKGDARYLEAFLAADEPWLRRSAVAVLAYVRSDAADIERAETDIRRFLETVPADTQHVTHAPYPLLFDHYFCLIANWSEEETRRLVPVTSTSTEPGALRTYVHGEADQIKRIGRALHER